MADMIDRKKLGKALKLADIGVKKGYFPGATVAVGSKNGVYEMCQFGKASLYPKESELNRGTLYDLASLTKVVGTTILTMRFLERGIITLHDRVVEYIPEFEGEEKEKITLFNLLTHTSGLPAHLPLYQLCSDYEDAIRYISGVELDYSPGTQVIYSDLGFIVLGYILEQVGEDRLDALCQRYIFMSLDMLDTGFNPSTDNVAATEVDRANGEPIVGKCHDENGRFFGGVSGHAGLFSNIDDMIKFANMLINKGKASDGIFLAPTTFETMIRNYTSSLNEDRAIGWCVKGTRGRISSGGDIISTKAFGHTGFTGTSIWVDIENDLYVILLTNRVHPTRDNNSILRFRRAFHNCILASKRD